MRGKHLVIVLILLVLALPAAPAHAGGIVSTCDETHLKAALTGGGTVTFSCSGTITLTSTITIAPTPPSTAAGRRSPSAAARAVRVFTVTPGVTLNLNKLTVANGYADDYGGGIYNTAER